MTDEEMQELVRRAEAGERVVINCDHSVAMQAHFMPFVSSFVIKQHEGFIGFKNGGALVFRSTRIGMSQNQVLQEAVTKALNGEHVYVTARSHVWAEELKFRARKAIPDKSIANETRQDINFKGGGVLRFRFLKSEHDLRGICGEVYLIQENGELWDRGPLPYRPPRLPRTRFERINDE